MTSSSLHSGYLVRLAIIPGSMFYLTRDFPRQLFHSCTLRTSVLLQGGVKLCDLTDGVFPKSRGFISNEHLMIEPIKNIGKGGTRENMNNRDNNNRPEDE